MSLSSPQNYDQAELDKFAALSAHWWDIDGELKTLHEVNPIRLRFIAERVPLANQKMIDVGCGGGILTESLARAGAKVTGIDLNGPVINVAKLHQLESGTHVEYIETAIETFADAHPGEYDVVTCLELLEHVPNPESVIQACARLLKPEGHIFFSTINRNPKSYLYAIIGAEYILKILPKNTHDFAKFIRPSELSTWMLNAQLKPLETRGIAYQPWHKKFKAVDDVSVNYLLYGRK